MTDKELIQTKINELQEQTMNGFNDFDDSFHEGKYHALAEVDAYLDTFEEKGLVIKEFVDKMIVELNYAIRQSVEEKDLDKGNRVLQQLFAYEEMKSFIKSVYNKEG